jgi:hypothetical protein
MVIPVGFRYSFKSHGGINLRRATILKLQHEEESAFLRFKIEELNKNTVLLIAEAEKLIQESKQLSASIKSLANASTKPKWPPSTH